MKVKEFAEKYDVPAIRLRAALNLGKSRRYGGNGSTALDNAMDFSEEDMTTAWYAYLMEDMRACIERAAQDNQLLKEFVQKVAKE